MLNYAIPIIEQLAAGKIRCPPEIMEQVQERRVLAQSITSFLADVSTDKADYFYAIGRLLKMPEYRRLLLYLPLSDLSIAPTSFRGIYLNVWYRMLSVRDARENFFEGDTYEVDARPNGKLERVVKCAHLTPWLVEAKLLGYAELKAILSTKRDNTVLLRSFANTWRMMRDRELLLKNELDDLENYTAHITQRENLEPLYISDRRREWLCERERRVKHGELLTPQARLAGPFSPNMEVLQSELEIVQASLESKEVVLVGGSRLRGYGVCESDLDILKLCEVENNPMLVVGNPHGAAVYYNTFWLGGSAVKNLDEIAMSYAAKYFGRLDRTRAIEKLENDLLQYRLLHKGFVRFYGAHNSTARQYAEMDGDCPFYDDMYRRIATELFAKYIFIPK